MMLVVIVAVTGAFIARQFTLGSSDRRSVEQYERRLSHLGGVARRGDREPSSENAEVAYAPAHIGPLPHAVAPAASLKNPPPVAPPLVSTTVDTPLVFGDDDLVPPSSRLDAPTAVSTPHGAHISQRRGRLGVRQSYLRIAVPSVVVIAAAAVVLGVSLSRGSSDHETSSASHHGEGSTRSSTTTTTVPAEYVPTSTSATLVTYDVPAGEHTISFSTSARCWVGVESSQSGPYLWMDTINPGSKAMYRASSGVVVRVGAPTSLSIAVDGIPVIFPKGQSDPVDLAIGDPTAVPSGGTAPHRSTAHSDAGSDPSNSGR